MILSLLFGHKYLTMKVHVEDILQVLVLIPFALDGVFAELFNPTLVYLVVFTFLFG